MLWDALDCTSYIVKKSKYSLTYPKIQIILLIEQGI